MFKSTIFPLSISLLIFFTSCHLTRKSVIGTWKENFGDTIIINDDNSFLLIKANIFDTVGMNLTGTWTVNKQTLYFSFTDATKDLGGGCKSFRHWSLNSRKTLVRPVQCKTPTHHFTSIRKID